MIKKITPLQYAIFLYEITLKANKMRNKGLALRLSKGFLEILAKNNDLGKIDEIIKEFETYEKKQRGTQDIEIISAKPLAQGIKKQLVGLTGDGKPEIKESVNPDLLGGITLIIGDMMIDGSIRSKLRELNKLLSYGG